ncbi:hypothetical protein EDB82DRAFT_504096 [Fusarium venenatum]|uniref:uncharacterized protein n=1 Tax=Fusarium venenatum TaxID=56646 RepID=UPI001D6E8DB7|nr:hypothetical protein EDB82DRAFT_504096 [Fusarium venenatum]
MFCSYLFLCSCIHTPTSLYLSAQARYLDRDSATSRYQIAIVVIRALGIIDMCLNSSSMTKFSTTTILSAESPKT